MWPASCAGHHSHSIARFALCLFRTALFDGIHSSAVQNEYVCSTLSFTLPSSSLTTSIQPTTQRLNLTTKTKLPPTQHPKTNEMCYIVRTRYSCTHLATFHPSNYKRPIAAQDAIQANSKTEWPTHAHTTLEGCQDACRRGARCSGRLDDLEVVEKRGDGVCEECEDAEWVVVERGQWDMCRDGVAPQ